MENIHGFSVDKVDGMIWLSFYDHTGKGEVIPLSEKDARRVAEYLINFLGPEAVADICL